MCCEVWYGASSPARNTKRLLKGPTRGQWTQHRPSRPPHSPPASHLPLLCHLNSARHTWGEEMSAPPFCIKFTHSGGKVNGGWLIYRVEQPTPHSALEPLRHLVFLPPHPVSRNPSIYFLALGIFFVECLIHRQHVVLHTCHLRLSVVVTDIFFSS